MTREEISQLCFRSYEWRETPRGHVEEFRCTNAPEGHEMTTVHTYLADVDELIITYTIDGEEYASGLPVLEKLRTL